MCCCFKATIMSISNGFAGLSNCCVSKSWLQEYAQRACLTTPVYETVNEGPSHHPCFRSTVIVDNVRYDSLPGFSNRKTAEQSAAEVALLELGKLGCLIESSSSPVHERGLCKNLLQEYARKMNFAVPSYACHTDEAPGRRPFYSCTLDIGGVSYIGALASSKKEAKFKAACTALLAIQSNTNGAGAKANGNPQLTVLPTTKQMAESDTKKGEIEKFHKPRNPFKKRWSKEKKLQKKHERATRNVKGSLRHQVVSAGMMEAGKISHIVEHVGSQLNENQPLSVAEWSNKSQNGQTASNLNPSHQGFFPKMAEANDLRMQGLGVNKVAGEQQEAQIGEVVVPGFTSETFGSEIV